MPSLDITDSITIYAWIKTSATGDWWEIIGKVPGFPRPGYVLYVNPDSKIQCEIIKEFPNIAGITESTTSIEAGEWHHAACVYDGSAVKVYVNGVLEASNPYSSGISANNAPLRIGDKFDGLIEEVTIYNRALTATEIRAIYDAGSAEKVKPPPITDTILAPSGLVGWWPGDGNSNDTIGGNDGTLIGSATFVEGLAGQAFKFDGVDDGVEIPNTNGVFDLVEAWTIDAWVRPLAAGIDGRSDPIVWKIATNGLNQDTFLLNWHYGNTFKIGLESASGGVDFSTQSSSHTPDQWYHVVGLYDGANLKIYVNGELEGSRAIGQVVAYTGPAPLRIGNNLHSNHRSKGVFDGLIDEVKIFSRALTATEIKAIYDEGSLGDG